MNGCHYTEVESGLKNRISFLSAPSSETSSTSMSSTPSFFSPVSENVTETKAREEDSGRLFRISFEEDSCENIQPAALDVSSKSVNAVVTGIYKESVLYRVQLGDDEYVEIKLPRALAPDNIFWGMPVSIELDRSTGYVRPVIKERQAPPVDTEELSELDRLIDRL